MIYILTNLHDTHKHTHKHTHTSHTCVCDVCVCFIVPSAFLNLNVFFSLINVSLKHVFQDCSNTSSSEIYLIIFHDIHAWIFTFITSDLFAFSSW